MGKKRVDGSANFSASQLASLRKWDARSNLLPVNTRGFVIIGEYLHNFWRLAIFKGISVREFQDREQNYQVIIKKVH